MTAKTEESTNTKKPVWFPAVEAVARGADFPKNKSKK
jgi:hypothetical protein